MKLTDIQASLDVETLVNSKMQELKDKVNSEIDSKIDFVNKQIEYNAGNEALEGQLSVLLKQKVALAKDVEEDMKKNMHL